MTLHFGKVTQIKLVGNVLYQRDPLSQRVSLRARLLEMKRRAHNLEVPFRAFLEFWYERERREFEIEGDPAWPALSPLYRAWKARHFPGKTILRRTDRLYESLTSPGGENIAMVTPRTIRFGTRVPYWGHHQRGSGVLPRRPPLVMRPAWLRELARSSMVYVLDRQGQ